MNALWMTEMPPFVAFFVAAVLVGLTRGRVRGAIAVATPLLSALQLSTVPEGVHWQLSFMGLELTPYRVDGLSLIFAWAFHIAALLGVIYSLHVKDTLQQVAALFYAGSALGAVFAGDLLTLFVFWELLALSSVLLIWARRTDSAYRAGMRYLIFQVLSGLMLLVGALLYGRANGSLDFGFIGLEGIGSYLIFLAFGIKCAFPLMHSWLIDAYPEATPTGTVFLSAFTTKVAVYALARGFAGTEALVYIGAVMTCFPIFYAVIENDLRRVLAYSLINQVGFMVCGIGIGSALALNGALAHAFNDVIFKGLLFMSMGAVLQMTGRINGSELGGLYKTMPKTTLLCIVGAASISAFPLFSGFVSKSMVMSAVLEDGHDWVWLMLLFASAGVFHHAGIKIPYFAFFAHDSGIRAADPPRNMLVAMSIAAFLCIAIGVYPAALYQLLPFAVDYSAYDVTHVLAQMQLLFFSALAFVWLNLRGLYPPELPSVNLDVDWLYRRLLPRQLQRGLDAAWSIDQRLRKGVMARVKVSLNFLLRHEPDAIFNRTNLSGSMVLWVGVILAWFLVLSLQ
jgi:multicomponent Na+:H+ antiporter subunit D